jgi:Fe-S-cluster-containing hydrogenase component 2
MIDEKTLKTRGAPSLSELAAAGMLPSMEDMARSACLCIECVEEIPCNPCETSCPHGAIKVGDPITNLPVFDRSKCTACGLCIPACPGQAITIKQIQGDLATIRFPWEYVPVPSAGDAVDMLDRYGDTVCRGKILGANTAKRNDRTVILTAEFPAGFSQQVITIRRKA